MTIYHDETNTILEGIAFADNTPEWAQDLREQVLGEQSVSVLVAGKKEDLDSDSRTLRAFQTLADMLHYGEDPLDKYHRTQMGTCKKRDMYTAKEFNPAPLSQARIGYQRHISFRSPREYATVLYAASWLEDSNHRSQITVFESTSKQLKLVPLAGQEGVDQNYSDFFEEDNTVIQKQTKGKRQVLGSRAGNEQNLNVNTAKTESFDNADTEDLATH